VTEPLLDRFERQIESLVRLSIPVASDSIGELKKGKHHVAVTFDDCYESTLDRVIPILSKKGVPVTFFAPSAHLGKDAAWITDSDRRQFAGPIITAEKLRQISKNPLVSIGSHGINHRRLTEMSDDDARGELSESKRTIEEIIGKKVKIFGVPYGAYHSGHIEIAKEAGYEWMFTDDFTYITGKGNEFVIGRTEVNPTDWPLEFALKMTGAYRWHNAAIHLKRRLLQARCLNELFGARVKTK